jgi:hypothetical protein
MTNTVADRWTAEWYERDARRVAGLFADALCVDDNRRLREQACKATAAALARPRPPVALAGTATGRGALTAVAFADLEAFTGQTRRSFSCGCWVKRVDRDSGEVRAVRVPCGLRTCRRGCGEGWAEQEAQRFAAVTAGRDVLYATAVDAADDRRWTALVTALRRAGGGWVSAPVDGVRIAFADVPRDGFRPVPRDTAVSGFHRACRAVTFASGDGRVAFGGTWRPKPPPGEARPERYEYLGVYTRCPADAEQRRADVGEVGGIAVGDGYAVPLGGDFVLDRRWGFVAFDDLASRRVVRALGRRWWRAPPDEMDRAA